MPRQREGTRVLGPYRHRQGWRLVLVSPDGSRDDRKFATEAEAKEVARELLREIERQKGVTLGEALEEHLLYLKEVRGNKPGTLATARYRLTSFFGQEELDLPLAALSHKRCQALYKALAARQRADTHQNTLILVKAFFAWCKKQKHLTEKPAAEIEPIGKRHRGKEQLRLDEARQFFRVAVELAGEGKTGALAALCALLLGLRASEIVGFKVRDLDDGGRLLWVARSKTQAGVRRLEIPEVLQPLLRALAREKLSTAPLFGKKKPYRREWPREWVHRICDLAGVPPISAHGLRGLHATLATSAGATAWAVAGALGHTSPAVTQAHYTRPEATEQARQAKVIQLFGEAKS